jgi:two-component system, OmpR family, sensor kinase
MGRRLFVKIYASFLAISALCILAAGMLVHLFHDRGPVPPHLHEVAEVFVESLPAEGGEAMLRERAERLGLVIGLFDEERRSLMATGEVPAPREREGDHWVHRGRGPFLAIHLRDGRWVMASTEREGRKGASILLLLIPLAGLAAAGTYPLARSITRRVENLRHGVDELGAGDLSSRVEVCGVDEVAALATSFNRAADRIEALVTSQRHMLASASHELRSPLARLRLSVELLNDAGSAGERDTHLAEAVRNIGELDRLIEDLLLIGRLEARAKPVREPVDLLALAAEEGARVDADVGGGATTVAGDEALLRILLRNLLENAARHGSPPIEIDVSPEGGGARVVVRDGGPGVPEDLRERIFEPFVRPAGQPEGEQSGAGLGLSLVRRVAELHGGTVRCEPGDGGRFVVELPPDSSSS